MSTPDYRFLQAAPVIPVLVIHDVATAVPMARALVEGGLPVLEVTLRTACALEAIAAIAREVPAAIVGAGTVCNADQLTMSQTHGAQFIVSPGSSQALFQAAHAAQIPLLPGVCTASEMIQAMDAGFSILKFFPAEANGGVAALKAFSGPFPQLQFCPTGGINRSNLADYLSVNSVIAVGGSWVTPPEAVQAQDWDTITQLAKQSVTLAQTIMAAA